jgi:hypothetical protein
MSRRFRPLCCRYVFYLSYLLGAGKFSFCWHRSEIYNKVVAVFWHVTLRHCVIPDVSRKRVAFVFFLDSETLKMKAIVCFETSGIIYPREVRHIRDHWILSQRCQNRKTRRNVIHCISKWFISWLSQQELTVHNYKKETESVYLTVTECALKEFVRHNSKKVNELCSQIDAQD